MMQLSRVVWTEGMHLGPHHFQAQNRYFEDSIQFITSALWFAPYGLIRWSVDPEALRNDTLAVQHASGVFPDGLFFQMPECDALPEAINLDEKISPIRNAATILLAVPRFHARGGDAATPNGTLKRFVPAAHLLPDENTGGDPKSVTLGRKNIRLLLDDEIPAEANGGEVVLPIARVIRDSAGHFVLDANFVPPCLNIGGSPRLMSVLRRLVEILEAKSTTLTQPFGARSFAEHELMKFWLLHAVNSNLAQLKHLYMSRRGHPEQLYLAMAGLAGALCTFGIKADALQLPSYSHDALTGCFEALDQHIREHLELVVPTNVISIELTREDESFYSGRITDQRCLGRSKWILGISASISEPALISTAPRLIKMCSQLFIRELVRRAIPGLELTHQPHPPSAISPRLEFQYFGVTKSGPCWDHIMESHQVGVYVPAELVNTRLELVVVLDNSV